MSSSSERDYICDVCGKPATQLARDVFRHEPPGDPYASFSPSSHVKAGCDEHPVTSEEYVTQLPLSKDE